jgi:hypothetical protein
VYDLVPSRELRLARTIQLSICVHFFATLRLCVRSAFIENGKAHAKAQSRQAERAQTEGTTKSMELTGKTEDGKAHAKAQRRK